VIDHPFIINTERWTLTAALVVMRDDWPISINVDRWLYCADQWEQMTKRTLWLNAVISVLRTF